MTTQAMVAKSKVFLRFTAVDLVTLAVFAALYRALWYVWNALSFLFPFNQLLNAFFYCLCGVAALVIVRKVGAATLFVIGATLIDVLIQGEALIVAAVVAVLGISADIYCYLVKASGHDPFGSMRHMFIAGTIWSIFLNLALWPILFKLVFQAPMDDAILIAVTITGIIAGMIGGALGFGLGDRTKGLIG